VLAAINVQETESKQTALMWAVLNRYGDRYRAPLTPARATTRGRLSWIGWGGGPCYGGVVQQDGKRSRDSGLLEACQMVGGRRLLSSSSPPSSSSSLF